MKSISLKPSGAVQSLRIFEAVSRFTVENALTIAAISAALCFIGLLCESDALQLTAGSVALAAVYCSTKSGKEVENER